MSDLSYNEAREAAMLIVEKLVVHEDEMNTQLVTPTRRDYRLLLRAALNGMLNDRVVVGRSGIYINNVPVGPPTEFRSC
jgi:hypothetical protein